MKILVTGASGYIGRHFVLESFRLGYETLGVDIKPDSTKSLKNLFQIDIRDTDKIIEFIRENDIKIVINFAGKKSVTESFIKQREYFETNTYAVDKILSRLSETSVNKFINASSAAVYGLQKSTLVHEELVPNPQSPYAESKMQSELLLKKWSSALGLKTYSLRFFNVGGSLSSSLQDKSKDNLIPLLIRKHKSKERIEIYGSTFQTIDGTAIRDYVHVIDVSRAILKLIEIQELNASAFELNIGSGVGTSVLGVIDKLSSIIQEKIEFTIGEKKLGDIPSVIADISRARELIDFKPEFTLDQIISSSI
jgi:UDP-glucose 4-epimerase